MALKIAVPDDISDDTCCLVKFTNGELSDGASSKPKFTLYNKTSERHKRRKVLVAETEQLTYIGDNYDSESLITSGSNNFRYYIGAVDRKASTLTLHKAEIFTLKPWIPGHTDTVGAVDVTSTGSTPTKAVGTPTKAEQFDQMVSLFGSERQKRAYSASKRNKVEQEALESALASAVSHAQTAVEQSQTEADGSVSLQSSGLMPPHNPQAEVPQDVYNINDVISQAEMKLLKKTAKVFLKATPSEVHQWRTEQRYPEYILDHIDSLSLAAKSERAVKAAIVTYCFFLMTLHTTHPRHVVKGNVSFLDVAPPTEVQQQLMSRYVEGGGSSGGTRSFSPRMRDKVLLHLFVLTLFLDDFSISCHSLQRDLKLTSNKVVDFYRALGCSVAKTTVKRQLGEDHTPGPAHHTATLKIPLNFPKPKKSHKKKT